MRFWVSILLMALGLSTAHAQFNNPPASVNTSQFVTKNSQGQVASMAAGVAGSTVVSTTANSTENSTSDTSCYGAGVGSGATISANTVYVGTTYRLTCFGNYSTPFGNVSTITAKVKWGSTTVASVTTPALPVSATNFPFRIDVMCTVRTIGATGTMVCSGGLSYISALTNSSFLFNAIQTTSPITIDTTAASIIDITAAWSAVTTQVASGLVGIVEILY